VKKFNYSVIKCCRYVYGAGIYFEVRRKLTDEQSSLQIDQTGIMEIPVNKSKEFSLE